MANYRPRDRTGATGRLLLCLLILAPPLPFFGCEAPPSDSAISEGPLGTGTSEQGAGTHASALGSGESEAAKLALDPAVQRAHESRAHPPSPPPSSDNVGAQNRGGSNATPAGDQNRAPPPSLRALERHRIWPQTGWARLLQTRVGLFLAAYVDNPSAEESLLLGEIQDSGELELLVQRNLGPRSPGLRRNAAPALRYLHDTLTLAFVGPSGDLQLLRYDRSRRSSEHHRFNESASPSFAPILLGNAREPRLVWSQQVGTRMSARSARIGDDGTLIDVQNVESDGASSAPTHDPETPDRSFFLLDPRQGISVLHRIFVEEDSGLRHEVAATLTHLQHPASLAIHHTGNRSWLAYAATGSMARSAVGLLPLPARRAPRAIVPGRGLGRRHVDGASSRDGSTLFWAAESAVEAHGDERTEVWVRSQRGDRLGPPLVVRGAGDRAARPNLVAVNEGALSLLLSDAEGLLLVRLSSSDR